MTKEWEKYYSNLEKIPEGIRKPRNYVKEFAKGLKEQNKMDILDLGCGFGRHLIYLAEQGFNVKGIDISKEAIEMAETRLREKGLNAELKQEDMKDLSFNESQFDAVIAITVIGHATKPDISKTVNEIHRVLKPEGVFYGNIPSKTDSRYKTGQAVEEGETYRTREYGYGRGIKEIHSFYTEEELRDLFKEFRDLEIELLKFKGEEIQSYKIIAKK